MYYDPSNPATFGPNTSVAYGGLPAQMQAPVTPAAPPPPTPTTQPPINPALPAQTMAGPNTARKRTDRHQRRLEQFANRIDSGHVRFNPHIPQRLFPGAPFMANLQPFDMHTAARSMPGQQFNQARQDWNNQFIQAFNAYRQATPDWMTQLGNAYYAGLPEGHRRGLLARGMGDY